MLNLKLLWFYLAAYLLSPLLVYPAKQVQEEEEVSKTLQIHAWMVVASRSHSRQL
jgi:hypothetical protein